MSAPKIMVSINSTWNFLNFRAGLIRALKRDGYELVAVAPDDGHANELRDLGCRYVPIRLVPRGRSIASDLKLLHHFRSIIRQEKPHLLLTFTIKPNIYGTLAARSLGVPTIANVAGLGTAFLRRGILNQIIRQLYATALRPSDVTFFQNSADRALFVGASIVRSESAYVLPGSGVDLDRYSLSGEASDTAETKFLLIARLLWAKGIAEYVRAASDIRAKYPQASFQILGMQEVGAGAVDAAEIARWHAGDAVEYLGSVSDVRPIIAGADCVVLPSFYPEGTPRALLEAAAMGKPIITTDMPGCRDVVEDECNGFLVPPRDAAALERALERFIALDAGARKVMGLRSRSIVETRFDERLVIASYREAISRFLE